MKYGRLFRLDDRIAVVIGAGSGIGEAAAKGLAAHGAFVVCADLERESAERTASAIGDQAQAVVVDVTKTKSVEELFRTTIDQHRRLDIVVTTPGANVRKHITAYQDVEFDRVVELNLKGTFRVLREAGRLMSQQRSGSIIAFSSIRSQVVEPGQGVYAATKAGIVQNGARACCGARTKGRTCECDCPGSG